MSENLQFLRVFPKFFRVQKRMNLGITQLVTAVWTSTKCYIQACSWILQKQHSRTGSTNSVRRGYDAAADASTGALVTLKQMSGAYFIWWTSEEPRERISLEKSIICDANDQQEHHDFQTILRFHPSVPPGGRRLFILVYLSLNLFNDETRDSWSVMIRDSGR